MEAGKWRAGMERRAESGEIECRTAVGVACLSADLSRASVIEWRRALRADHSVCIARSDANDGVYCTFRCK